MDAIASIATAAVYLNGDPATTITGKAIAIGQGWPLAEDLDAAMAAGASIVTIFAVPGATAQSEQLFEQPVVLVPAVHGMSVSTDDKTVMVTGTPGVGEYLTLVIDAGFAYSHAAVSGDTNVTMAAALAAAILVNYPGTAASNGVITIPGSHKVVARIGAPATMGLLTHRQRQQFRVSVWAPNPADRTTIAKAIDVAAKSNLRIILADSSQAILRYESTLLSDQAENKAIYRRDLVYSIEYGTLETYQAWEITSFTMTISPNAQASFNKVV
jgi:hypothetical protein